MYQEKKLYRPFLGTRSGIEALVAAGGRGVRPAMTRKGKGKAVPKANKRQPSLAKTVNPTLKKVAAVIGRNAHVPGDFWDKLAQSLA